MGVRLLSNGQALDRLKSISDSEGASHCAGFLFGVSCRGNQMGGPNAASCARPSTKAGSAHRQVWGTGGILISLPDSAFLETPLGLMKPVLMKCDF